MKHNTERKPTDLQILHFPEQIKLKSIKRNFGTHIEERERGEIEGVQSQTNSIQNLFTFFSVYIFNHCKHS
jgi:hypothetical protein